MENRNNVLIITLVAVMVLISWGLTKNFNEHNAPPMPAPIQNHICKEDSLQGVINQLIVEKETEEDGWDKKETRYENILFEYEFGLDRIKETHPNAYKEFHRIIAFREQYSREAEKENKKRLNVLKF
jgi:hypothetical protein